MNWRKRSRREQDLEPELRNHLELEAGEQQDRGLFGDQAAHAARRLFGNATLVAEQTREMWGWTIARQLAQDLRYGARVLRKNPAFTAVAVLALGTGIGANTALFTAMDALLWKPLPVHQPEQLVTITGVRPDGRELHGIPSTFVDNLRHEPVFSDVLTTTSWDGLSLSLGDATERIMGEAVSPNYFAVLGVTSYLGQGFTPGSWKPEAVLTYSFWLRRFHGDPRVIGTTIHLNTYPFTIVGVAPAGFFGTEVGISPELRLPMMPAGQSLDQVDMVDGKSARAILAIGRLKEGISLARAEAATDAQFQHFLEQADRRVEGVELRRVRLSSAARGTSEIRAEFTRPLAVLFAAVGLLLIAACATVANLLLAKAGARRREMVMRTAIGAGRGRLLRQLLTESVLLSLLGGSAGLALSFSITRALFAYLPQTHRLIVLDLQPDRGAIAFAFITALSTGLLFGVVPAMQSISGAVAEALKNDSAASLGRSSGRGWLSFRRVLVALQVALSLLLIVGAALLVRSLRHLRQENYGFAPGNVLLFTMKPQHEVYNAESIRRIAAEVERRVDELPGVAGAAWAESGPLDSRGPSSTTVWLSGREIARPLVDAVTPGFFETTGIPLLHGPVEPILYRAFAQTDPYMPTLHVKTTQANTASLVEAVRRQFATVDRGVPVFNIKRLTSRVEESLARERLLAALSTAFGLVALLLAAVGLYGVIAYEMGRRTREIGIRMALGARRGMILGAVLRESVMLAVLGVMIGLPLAMASARLLSSYLYGVSAYDPLTGMACSALITAVAVMAGFIPAWRASRIDPIRALRHE